jgi:hypothetical protein
LEGKQAFSNAGVEFAMIQTFKRLLNVLKKASIIATSFLALL